MRTRFLAVAATTAMAIALSALPALAQSSGNFTAQVQTAACMLSDSTGGLSCSNGNADGKCIGSFSTTIKTPNSSQTALLITPSLVTGLFTDTNISGGNGGGKNTQTSASSYAGISVSVDLDGNPVAPDGGDGVMYDARFQEISTNLFSVISECTTATPCNLNLLLSTLSAHSFNFVAPSVGGGSHTITVGWTLSCYTVSDTGATSTSCSQVLGSTSAAGCAGPGSVTVEQVQNFSQDSGISIQ